jgi:hypothetical protein
MLTPQDSQLQFSEVRVSKLLHYLFTDRQELKILVLDEALLDFLEISYLHNKNIIQEFENKCRSFDHGYFECESYTKNDDEKLVNNFCIFLKL